MSIISDKLKNRLDRVHRPSGLPKQVTPDCI
jgi:hypothetical protein